MTDIHLPETEDASSLDIGRPVEWLLDPVTREVLGVTYEFSVSGERRSVWYTANKRKPKVSVVTSYLLDHREHGARTWLPGLPRRQDSNPHDLTI